LKSPRVTHLDTICRGESIISKLQLFRGLGCWKMLIASLQIRADLAPLQLLRPVFPRLLFSHLLRVF
jgi:hypothetical protein